MKPEEYERRASDLRILAMNMTMDQAQRIIKVNRKKLIELTEYYKLRWESREKKRILIILEQTVDPVLRDQLQRVLREQTSYADALKDVKIRERLREHKRTMRLHRFADSLIG